MMVQKTGMICELKLRGFGQHAKFIKESDTEIESRGHTLAITPLMKSWVKHKEHSPLWTTCEP
jgi:hypothetical protein